MMGRVRWTHATVALAVIGAVAIAAPALGGPSLKSLVKKEVAKQLAKATGPPGQAGANGLNGLNGTNGLDGTARAYARVRPHASLTPCTGGASGDECTFNLSKGITSVRHGSSTGIYCVHAPGISSHSQPAAVTVDWALTAPPPGNASAMLQANFTCHGEGNFLVRTEHQPETSVRNAADTGSVSVAGNAIASDSVGFTIVIP
jgi:hypothetical protein